MKTTAEILKFYYDLLFGIFDYSLYEIKQLIKNQEPESAHLIDALLIMVEHDIEEQILIAKLHLRKTSNPDMDDIADKDLFNLWLQNKPDIKATCITNLNNMYRLKHYLCSFKNYQGLPKNTWMFERFLDENNGKDPIDFKKELDKLLSKEKDKVKALNDFYIFLNTISDTLSFSQVYAYWAFWDIRISTIKEWHLEKAADEKREIPKNAIGWILYCELKCQKSGFESKKIVKLCVEKYKLSGNPGTYRNYLINTTKVANDIVNLPQENYNILLTSADLNLNGLKLAIDNMNGKPRAHAEKIYQKLQEIVVRN